MWNKFSGRDKFKQAEELYEQITQRYNERRKAFEKSVKEYTDNIERNVASINKNKEKIKRELFPAMAKKMEKIKDISVSDDFTVEKYIESVVSFDEVRSKGELYKIDFDNHKFKTSMQAIFTLGFYTRKKAKETLYAVEEEEAKVNAEIAKMDAELVKMKAIATSLENVEYYFATLVELYENLLIRLDNSVNFLYVNCLAFAHKLVAQDMSIRRLPVMQRKEVEAIITVSKILKAMTDAQITAIEDERTVVNYQKELKAQHTEAKKIYAAA